MRPGPRTASVARCQVISVIITEARSLGEDEAEAGGEQEGREVAAEAGLGACPVWRRV